MAVLFVGVAASSSFQHAVEQGLSPGQSARVGAYTVRYVKPTASVTPANDAAHTGALLSLGARLQVLKGRQRVATLEPSEGYYPSGEPGQGTVGSLIGGQPVSHIAMNGGITRDVWSAVEPDIEAPALQRSSPPATARCRPQTRSSRSGYLARQYLQHPPRPSSTSSSRRWSCGSGSEA